MLPTEGRGWDGLGGLGSAKEADIASRLSPEQIGSSQSSADIFLSDVDATTYRIDPG